MNKRIETRRHDETKETQRVFCGLVSLCLCVCISAMTGFASPILGAEYHVDSDSGNDANDGLSAKSPWKSLDPVNAKSFAAGDRILLKAGTHYSGQLALKGSGEKNKPIFVGMYGEGAKPRIDGEGKALDTLLLRNADYWEIRDLEITNRGESTAAGRTGVRIASDNYGTMYSIRLSGLFVHDVNGDLRKEREGCGIFFDSRGGNFDDLVIENCHVVHTDRNGICQRTQGRGRSLHVVIRGNLLEDIGGDGIKLWGSNGGLVEHNVIHGGRMRCADYAAGIWPFSCDDCVIQFNEVSGMHGTKDGQGFDSDYVCRRNIFQYNYSHDNDGGFMLICSPGNSYCQGTVIRYNISQNDGRNDSCIFHFAGNSSDTLIYNNVIYVGAKLELPLIECGDWSGGNAHHTRFFNNIFYVAGKVTYKWGKSSDTGFDYNVFYGQHESPPKDEHGMTAMPGLVKVGSGKDGMESLGGYKWNSSRDVIRGRVVEEHGGRDFFGNPVKSNLDPCVGVEEVKQGVEG
jgi:Right handed beta helix region